MRSLRPVALLPLALLIAACGSDETSGPGGMSPDEAQELNDAAAMLDANAVELDEVSPQANRQDPVR